MTHACKYAGLPTPTFESNSGGVLATFTLQSAYVEPVEYGKSLPAARNADDPRPFWRIHTVFQKICETLRNLRITKLK